MNQRVQSQGAGLTLSYAFAPALTVSGNYSYNDLITKDFKVGTQSFFNTPKHKFNLGLDGQALDRTLSYNVNYRWVDSLPLRVDFRHRHRDHRPRPWMRRWATSSSPCTSRPRQGVTNLFDAQNYQVYGAPSYGRLGYFGLLFDIK